MLDDIFQFADVAGVTVGHEQGQGRIVDAADIPVLDAVQLGDESFDENGDIFAFPAGAAVSGG